MPPLYRPSAEYVVGELIDAVGPDGQTVKVVLPQFAAVSSSGGAGQEVQGVNATGEEATGNPVLVGGLNGDNVAPITVDGDGAVLVGGVVTVRGVDSGASPHNLLTDTVGNLYSYGPLLADAGCLSLRINVSASGVTALLAAVASQKHRVYALSFSVAGAVNVELRDGATVLEVWNFAANGGQARLDFRSRPYWPTTANTALNLNLSGAVQVNGRLEYTTAV